MTALGVLGLAAQRRRWLQSPREPWRGKEVSTTREGAFTRRLAPTQPASEHSRWAHTSDIKYAGCAHTWITNAGTRHHYESNENKHSKEQPTRGGTESLKQAAGDLSHAVSRRRAHSRGLASSKCHKHKDNLHEPSAGVQSASSLYSGPTTQKKGCQTHAEGRGCNRKRHTPPGAATTKGMATMTHRDIAWYAVARTTLPARSLLTHATRGAPTQYDHHRGASSGTDPQGQSAKGQGRPPHLRPSHT